MDAADHVSYLKWVKDLDVQIASLHARGVEVANFAGSSLRRSKELSAIHSNFENSFDAQGPWGHPGLIQEISRNYSFPAENILVASGAGLAMFLVCRTFLDPDAVALVESPTYEPFLAAPAACGNEFVFLDRQLDTFDIDPAYFEEQLAKNSRVQLAILSNPHNPTGTVIPDERIVELAAIAERHGAKLVVDEIFRDLISPQVLTTASLHPNIVAINSLSKVYGLSQLRCAWILCAPTLHPHIQDTQIAIDNIGSPFLQALASHIVNSRPRLLQSALEHLSANTASVQERFRDLEQEGLIQGSLRPGQAICFPRLPRVADVGAFVEALADQHVFVVDGKYFRAPGHIRMGFGGDPQQINPGLDRFKALLRQHSHAKTD